MLAGVPFLAQIGEDAAQCPPGPKFIMGPDGLLRRDHANTPFIDELKELGAKSSAYDSSLITILTKHEYDSPDPDTIRVASSTFNLGIETIAARAPSPEHGLNS
jgi:hypothetical protein